MAKGIDLQVLRWFGRQMKSTEYTINLQDFFRMGENYLNVGFVGPSWFMNIITAYRNELQSENFKFRVHAEVSVRCHVQ